MIKHLKNNNVSPGQFLTRYASKPHLPWLIRGHGSPLPEAVVGETKPAVDRAAGGVVYQVQQLPGRVVVIAGMVLRVVGAPGSLQVAVRVVPHYAPFTDPIRLPIIETPGSASLRVGEQDPAMASSGDFDFDRDGIVAGELEWLRQLAVDAGHGEVGETGVVERDADLGFDLPVERIVQESHGFLLALRVDMQDAVPVEAVGAAEVDDIAVEHFAVRFVEGRPLLDDGLGGRGVVEARAAIAGLDTEADEIGKPFVIVLSVLVQRFDGGVRAAVVRLKNRRMKTTKDEDSEEQMNKTTTKDEDTKEQKN